MSLKFQVIGPPLLAGARAGVARFGAAFAFAGFFVFAVYFASFFFPTFIPLSMP